jgi:hypothetical protein
VIDEKPTVAERSVARGAAAPTTTGDAPTSALPATLPPAAPATYVPPAHAMSPPQATPPPAWPQQHQYGGYTGSVPPKSNNTLVFALVALLILVIGAGVAVFIVASGGDDDSSPTTQATDRTVTETQQSTTDSTEPTLPSGSEFEAFTADTGAYSADLPTGGGWSGPRERQVNPELWEVTSVGPDGMELLINYTPGEPASVTPDDSCVPVDHPAFSDARKCVFRGGAFEVCQRSRCIDYLLNDGSSGPGYAVLVGGGDPDEAERIADRVASSFRP